MSSRFTVLLFAVFALGAAACSRDPQKLKRAYVESGDRYVSEKKYDEAIVQYRNAVHQDASFGEARAKLATAYQATGDFRNALRESVRAADLMPGDTDVQLHAGGLLLAAGLHPEAKARALKVLEKDPKNVNGLILLGNALAGLKDVDGAISHIEEAIEADPHVTLSYANLGALQLAQGNRKAAEEAFKRAIVVEPQSAVAHRNLGGFYWAGGDRTNAERELKAALAIDPKSPDTNRSLTAFYLASPQQAQAELYLKAYIEAAPSVWAKLALADFYLTNNRTSDAVGVLKPLTSDKDGFAPASVRLASIDYQAGRAPQAHETLEGVLKRGPKDQQALEMKARFLIYERKLGDALKILNSVIERNPQAVPSYYLRGVAFQNSGSVDEAIKSFQKVEELAPAGTAAKMELAGLHLLRGDAKSSAEYSAQVIKAEPRLAAAYFAHAQALVKLGNLNGAERELLALARAFPPSADIHVWLGMVYESKGDLKRARDSYAHALQLQPKAPVAVAGLISADLTEKKLDSARARIETRLADNPDNGALLLLAASTYLALGDLQKAQSVYEHILKIDPANIDAFTKLGAIYASQNRLDEAKQSFEQAAKRQTNPVAATTMVGMILELQGKGAEARLRYQRALELDSKAAVAANNLAWMYAANGENLDMALQLAQTAKSQLPDNSRINDTLGWIYYKKGMATTAVGFLEEASKQGPANAAIRYRLGLAYLKAGDKKNARSSFEQALKLNPKFPEAEDARRMLATLKG
jgi:tetratricopeptide (TPR) repeat protein